MCEMSNAGEREAVHDIDINVTAPTSADISHCHSLAGTALHYYIHALSLRECQSVGLENKISIMTI